MTSTIITKNSSTASAVPLAADLTQGELAVNVTDKKLYSKNASGTVVQIGGTGDVVGPASSTDNALVRFDTTTGKLVQNSVGILSDTGAISGLTDVAASGSVTLSGGTANGVTYLNGSKVLTSGSALTFDSAGNFGLGTASPTASSSNRTLTINGPATFGSLIDFKTNETLNFRIFSGVSNSVLSVKTATPLLFDTNDIERMRIDASGNVGIGTSSPRSVGGYTSIGLNNTTGVLIDGFVGGTRTSGIATTASSMTVGTITSIPLTFLTADTERARIDSSGNLLVGTTTANPHSTGTYGSQLSVGGALIGVNNSHAIIAARWNGNGEVIRLQRDNTDVGSIDVTTTATSYNTSSDYRLKENIAPMTGALDTVAQLKPVTYTWKVNGTSSQGFIAHELQAVVPDCVTGEKDAVDEEGNPKYQGIDTSFLVATLTSALQELNAKFEAYVASHP